MIKTSKIGQSPHFCWTDDLIEVIERAKHLRQVGSFYLRPTQRGQRYTVDGFRQLWRRIMVR